MNLTGLLKANTSLRKIYSTLKMIIVMSKKMTYLYMLYKALLRSTLYSEKTNNRTTWWQCNGACFMGNKVPIHKNWERSEDEHLSLAQHWYKNVVKMNICHWLNTDIKRRTSPSGTHHFTLFTLQMSWEPLAPSQTTIKQNRNQKSTKSKSRSASELAVTNITTVNEWCDMWWQINK